VEEKKSVVCVCLGRSQMAILPIIVFRERSGMHFWFWRKGVPQKFTGEYKGGKPELRESRCIVGEFHKPW